MKLSVKLEWNFSLAKIATLPPRLPLRSASSSAGTGSIGLNKFRIGLVDREIMCQPGIVCVSIFSGKPFGSHVSDAQIISDSKVSASSYNLLRLSGLKRLRQFKDMIFIWLKFAVGVGFALRLIIGIFIAVSGGAIGSRGSCSPCVLGTCSLVHTGFGGGCRKSGSTPGGGVGKKGCIKLANNVTSRLGFGLNFNRSSVIGGLCGSCHAVVRGGPDGVLLDELAVVLALFA